jgi:hypothetical protein
VAFLTDPAIAVPAALGLFLLAKCYVAGRFSLTTASALLTTSPIDLFLGSVTLYEYALYPIIVLVGTAFLIHLRHQHFGIRSMGLLCIVLGALLLTPWPYAVFTLVFGLAIGLYHAIREASATAGQAESRRDRSRAMASRKTAAVRPFYVRILRRLPPTQQAFAVLLCLFTFGYIAWTLHLLWTPVEVITLKQGMVDQAVSGAAAATSNVVVGGVLASDSTWTTVIQSNDRRVMRIRTENIATRTICHDTSAQPRSLAPLWDTITFQRYESPNKPCATVLLDLTRG